MLFSEEAIVNCFSAIKSNAGTVKHNLEKIEINISIAHLNCEIF